ncbi:hypothetical protein AMJ49_06855 [Parcubacteria bacterium DG_74_2]|nr:MAG: hypothetical protein AMJ49_06855 [Parcubacteria bacterium DG_74_2]
MKTKTFNNKNIAIKLLSDKDLKFPEKFQNLINSLIEEDAQIIFDKKLSLKEERFFLNDTLKGIKNHQKLFMIAKYGDSIVGTTGISLKGNRQNHIGEFGIIIRKKFRGMGFGNYLMKETIKLARRQLKPRPKIIRTSVFSTNKPALNLYKKNGFKKVAKIPKQIWFQEKLVDEIIMLLDL